MRIRRAIVGAAVVLAASASVAVATSGSHPGLPSKGVLTVHKTISVQLSRAKGFYMAHAAAPGHADFGWHYHRTPVIVSMTRGTLTLYDSSDPTCSPHRYHAGQGFIEPANHIHLARNESGKPVSFYAVYIGVSAYLRAHPNKLDVFGQKRPSQCPPSVH
jgi:quercetin dioxygenase-like cupin family protein